MANQELRIRLVIENGQVRAGVQGVSKDIDDLANRTVRAGQKMADGMASANDALLKMQNNMERLQQYAATFLSFVALKQVVGGLISVGTEFQQMQYTMKSATGSAAAANNEIGYLIETTQRLGVSLEATAQTYGTYAVAARQAGLSTSTTRDLFTSLIEAGTVFHISSMQMRQAMVAIDQMMGQGVIKSQELRQQLGSAIPGAFEAFQNAVMKAEGVTRQQFTKMMQTGALDVQKYAPLLAEAFRNLVDPDTVAEAAQGMNASINRFQNSLFLFKASLADSKFGEAIAHLANSAATAVDSLTALSTGVGGTITIWGAVVFAVAAVSRIIGEVVLKIGTYRKALADAIVTERESILSKQRLATAWMTAGGAASGAAAKVTMASTAVAGFTVVGRGLLAILGGWPGLLITAGIALVGFANRTSEADTQIQNLNKSLIEGLAGLKNYTFALKEFVSGRTELISADKAYKEALKGDDQDVIDKAKDRLIRANEAFSRLGQTVTDTYADQVTRRDDLRRQLITQQRDFDQAAKDLAAAQAKLQAEAANGGAPTLQKVGKEAFYTPGSAAYQAAAAAREKADNRLKVARAGLTATTKVLAEQEKVVEGGRTTAEQIETSREDRTNRMNIAQEKNAAMTAYQAAAEKKRVAGLTLEQRITEELAKNKDRLATIRDPNQRADAEKNIKDMVTAQYQLEQLKKKVKDTTKEQEALAKAVNRSNDAIRSIEKITAEYNAQLMETDEITRQYLTRTASLDEAYKRALETINELKLPEKEKKEAVERLKKAYEDATAAVSALMVEERRRALVQFDQGLAEKQYDNDYQNAQASGNPLLIANAEFSKGKLDAENSMLDQKKELDATGLQITNPAEYAARSAEIENLYNQQIARMTNTWNMATNTFQGMAMKAEMWIKENLSDNILMALKGDYQGLADAWKNMLLKMVADFISSQILAYIDQLTKKLNEANQAAQGNGSGGGSSGGFWSSLFGIAVSYFTGGSAGGAGAGGATTTVGPRMADGGEISGPGTSTSDSILTPTSDGEFVIKAKAVRKYGRALFHALNGMSLPSAPRMGMANGGLIGDTGTSADLKMPANDPAAVQLRNQMRLYLFHDQEELRRALLHHPETEKYIVAKVGENKGGIQAEWG